MLRHKGTSINRKLSYKEITLRIDGLFKILQSLEKIVYIHDDLLQRTLAHLKLNVDSFVKENVVVKNRDGTLSLEPKNDEKKDETKTEEQKC